MKNKLKILIAEDDFLTQEMINFIFTKLDLDFKLVANGQKAYEEFKSKEYKLILMDLYMPIMSGIESINKIRLYEQTHELSPISIILLSADNIEDIERLISKDKIKKIVQKPLTKEKIKNILSEFYI